GGFDFVSAGPPFSGAFMQEILKICNELDIGRFGYSSQSLHVIVEAMKFAFVDRGLLGDPDFVNMTSLLDDIASPDYITQLAKKIQMDSVLPNRSDYFPDDKEAREIRDRGTSHFTVVDK